MKFNEQQLRLYAVTDSSRLPGVSLAQQAEGVLKGGATMVQLREKHLSREQFRAEALEIVEKLKNSPVKVAARAGANGKLFGAVTSKEVSDALQAQYGIELGKQKIVMDEPIKAYGSYQLKAKLGFEISGTVYVMVVEEK